MGFLDRLLGRMPQPQPTGGYEPPALPQQGRGTPPGGAAPSEDQRAVARYQYLLRTAPPERVEEVHAEAFAQLSPPQRQQVLARLGQDLPPGEGPSSDDPRDLARSATRAELRQPGYLQSAFAGPGMGSMMAGSMFGTIAGVVVGSAIAQSLLGGYESSPEAADAGEAGADGAADAGGGDSGAQGHGGEGDTGADGGGDFGGGDLGGGDFGGFGGGDFGGFDI